MDYTDKQLLVDQDYLLQKFPEKLAWTYAAIPEIRQDKHAYFGLVKVCGTIDTYEIESYNLMPGGNGMLILPVKAEIRKKIAKNEGDWVHITLYSLNLPTVVPEDFLTCLKEEPAAYKNFLNLPENEQNALIDWIYSAQRDTLKVERIVQAIDKLLHPK